MKRNPVELAVRALKNAFVNWQLVAIRMAESVVFIFLMVMALLATIIPAAVAAGLGKLNLHDAENAQTAVAEFIVDQWALILWTLVVLLLVTGVMIVIHSLIVAGSARAYLDGERAAGASDAVERFNVFRGDAFWAAAKHGFWRVFWIYNIGWGLAALIVSVPMLIALLLVRFTADTTTMVVLMIIIFALSFLMAIPIGIVTTIWVGRALIDGERNQLPAREALAAARRAIRADLAGHVVVPMLVALISLGGIAVASAITSGYSTNDIFGPFQFMGSLIQTFVSSLAGAWLLASFAALAENEGKSG
jgi:hypothetical protein